MKEEVPNRPDDISVEAWELAYDTNHALWAVCDDDPDDVKFWQDTKVIAHALLYARSQAFEESAKIAETCTYKTFMAWDYDGVEPVEANIPHREEVAQAIRQHSQKGER